MSDEPSRAPNDFDRALLERALALALANEAAGGLPVGAVVGLDGRILAEGASEVLGPPYHPGRHAEIQALAQVPVELWPRAAAMTVATTLEPCLMCFGACLLHGIGRIVFGALDTRGGARFIRPHLPPYYSGRGEADHGGPAWIGPCDPRRCDPPLPADRRAVRPAALRPRPARRARSRPGVTVRKLGG